MTDFSAWIEKNKALWTRVYDEVITPDFEEQWKKKDEEHKKELKQKEEHQQILFSHIETEVVKNARLVTENEQLKKQLQNQQGVAAPPSDHETVNVNKSTVSEDEYRSLTDKYNELSKKYQDVSQKMKYLERKNSAVMQKNKDMKESVRAWQEYVDRQSGKQKPKNETRVEDGKSRLLSVYPLQDDRPHMPSSPRSVATVRTPRSLAGSERSSPAPMAPLPQPVTDMNPSTSSKLVTGEEGRSPSASVTPKPRGHVESTEQQHEHITDPLNNERHAHSYLHQTNPSSSQTTVDEIAEQISRPADEIDAGDDDDAPQFVSERSLKRKRGQPSKSKFQIYADRSSDGTPAKPFRVKEEPHSSPPTTVHKLSPKEPIDLDDPAPNVLRTPRHPRRLSIFSDAAGALRHQRSNSEPLTQGIKRENTEAGNITNTVFPSILNVPNLHAGLHDHQVAIAEVRALSEPSDPTQTEEAVLRSLDLNILGSASEEPPNKRSRQAKFQQGAKHNILAESGEAPPPIDEDELRLPPHLARANLNRRLMASKNPQSPAKSLLQTPKLGSTKIKLEQGPTPPSSGSRSTYTPSGKPGLRSRMSKPRSKPRDDPTPDRPIWTMKASETRPKARKSRVSPSKEQVRLRDKPVSELNVQDFKPNPAYNQGYSYAFSETIRKRGDRMCLPGCTNPQCCGSTFRTFAEAQAPLPVSQEEALLEDYLGEAYNNMQLTQMSSEERKELVLQARTKKMAKESGKHREAYERRRTPPGFWRVDFPTTQEQQEDRERAKEQEKKNVQERWLEAQRKGGKWIFRDE